MLFIETSIFTKQIKDLVSDEEYRQLQQDLLVQSDKGDLIKNGGSPGSNPSSSMIKFFCALI